jgi:hypothetical protein
MPLRKKSKQTKSTQLWLDKEATAPKQNVGKF